MSQTCGSHKLSFIAFVCRKLFKLIIEISLCSIFIIHITSLMQVSADYTVPTSLNLTASLTPMGLQLEPHIIQLWHRVSKWSIWAITSLSGISLFVLIDALILMLTRYKRSNYFHFMTTMISVDLIMLITIIFNLLTSSILTNLKGPFVCKLTSFITNLTRCFVNWAWVMMFCQRFANIYFSIHRTKNSKLRIFEDSRRLLLVTFLISVAAQSWVPLLMNEVDVLSATGVVEATNCAADVTIVNTTISKCVVVIESFLVYFLPFIITVFTDVAILFFTRESKWFMTISSQTISKNDHGHLPPSLKIQSERSIKATNRRRRFAIKRCLALATTQLFLNLPYHIVVLMDEFFAFRNQSTTKFVIYIYGDSFCYLLYLLQFPLIALFVRLLHSNYDDRSKYKSYTLKQLADDAHSLQSHISQKQPCLEELETLTINRDTSQQSDVLILE